jgi:hypothetical protein
MVSVLSLQQMMRVLQTEWGVQQSMHDDISDKKQ